MQSWKGWNGDVGRDSRGESVYTASLKIFVLSNTYIIMILSMQSIDPTYDNLVGASLMTAFLDLRSIPNASTSCLGIVVTSFIAAFFDLCTMRVAVLMTLLVHPSAAYFCPALHNFFNNRSRAQQPLATGPSNSSTGTFAFSPC